VHWCLWAFGGNLVDAKDKVIINSPETGEGAGVRQGAVEPVRAGCASWNDAFNNKAFLESQISLTNNGVSIYAAAKANAGKDPKAKEVMDDMNHSLWPIGPVGKPTEFHICYPMLAMKYTKRRRRRRLSWPSPWKRRTTTPGCRRRWPTSPTR
jgi:multiple sugar transport system substrate-binding protein